MYQLSLHSQQTPGLTDSRSLDIGTARLVTNFTRVAIDAAVKQKNGIQLLGGLFYQVNGSEETRVLNETVGGNVGFLTNNDFQVLWNISGGIPDQSYLHFSPGGTSGIRTYIQLSKKFKFNNRSFLDVQASGGFDSAGTSIGSLNLIFGSY